MKLSLEQIQALRAEHGPRLMILRAGADDIAALKPTAAEYAELRTASRDNPDWQELALLRAVVAPAGVAKELILQEVNAILDEDPQLADVLGSQLMAACGVRARVTSAKGEGRKVTLTATIALPGGEELTLSATRPGRGQWKDIRRAISKAAGEDDAGPVRCWELCGSGPADLAERYPALPAVLGAHLLGLMTRSPGDPSL